MLKKQLRYLKTFIKSVGISFLEVKYQLLLSYLVNLTYLLLQKARGQSINGDRAVLRLVEIRTVLEKMRPIDQKLKYQVDKVVRLAATDGDETMLEKKQRQVDHLRKRALNSDILQDLREQYDEGPQEIRETHDMHRLKENKRAKEKTRVSPTNEGKLKSQKEKARKREKRVSRGRSDTEPNRYDEFKDLINLFMGDMSALTLSSGNVNLRKVLMSIMDGTSIVYSVIQCELVNNKHVGF
ncbi:NGDN-like protein [Mya arenaria]|uniref:NGDN-like protein n=1 Tax=Mya arenaria TaxID=6604 RepID=A0ABY7ETM0_MYAAR|nr:NGDN-like protein [Mya arenaria]